VRVTPLRGLAVAIDDGFSADEREVLNRAVSLLARLTRALSADLAASSGPSRRQPTRVTFASDVPAFGRSAPMTRAS
jgi:hypothetical protein